MKLKTICVSIIIWILCIFAYGYGEFVTNDTCTADSIELKSYYDPEESKCYMREYLRDVSAYRSCTQFKRGQLLGPKSKTKLAKIVDELKADDSTNGEVPVSVNIETSEFLKLDQTVSIVVHLPEIEGPETSNQTLPSFEVQFKSYAGSYLFGVSLRIKIDMVYQDNQLVIANWIGGSNVQFDKFPNIEYDLPLNNWDFKFNVTLKEANKFEITIGHEQPFMYPKLNMGPVSGTHVIDRYIITAENGAQPKSLKIDDNELLLDPYFSDCMAVGLISDKENNWFWEDRKDLEESTVVNGPDIEAQKLYGCVDVNTLPYPEFFTFPAQLMKFVICQYFATCSKQANKDIQDSNLSSVSNKTESECCSICQSTDGCRAYSWTSHYGSTCWLKHSIGPIIDKTDVHVGVLEEVQTKQECTGLVNAEKTYYAEDDQRCYALEGLRDVSSNRSCNLLPNGQLLDEIQQEKLNTILGELKYDTKNIRMDVQTTEKLEENEVVLIRYQLSVKSFDIDNDPNTKLFTIEFQGIDESNQKYAPLVIHITKDPESPLTNGMKMLIARRRKSNFDTFFDEADQGPVIAGSTSSHYDLTFAIKYNTANFEVTVNGKHYEFHERETSFINHYIINSINPLDVVWLFFIANQQVQDYNLNPSYCLAVGLISDNQKDWFWERRYPAYKDETLWDQNEPENDRGHYGCVDIKSNKYKSFPSYLKKYLICEYKEEKVPDDDWSVIINGGGDTDDENDDISTDSTHKDDDISTDNPNTNGNTHIGDGGGVVVSPPLTLTYCTTSTANTNENRKTLAETISEAVQSLGWFSIIGSCSAIIVIFIFLRDFTYERCLHMGQEVCLVFAHLILIFFWDKTQNDILCGTASLGVRFFITALFVFIFLESFHNYNITTNVVRRGAWLSRPVCQLLAWGGAAISVALAVAIASFNKFELLSSKSCWLNYGDKLICLAMIFPIMVGFTVAAIFTEAAGIDFRKPIYGYSVFQRKAAVYNKYAMILLLPLQFGSFFLNSLAIYYMKTAKMLFLCHVASIVNDTLSVTIFICHCFANPTAHALLIRLWSKLKSKLCHCKRTKVTDVGPRYVYHP